MFETQADGVGWDRSHCSIVSTRPCLLFQPETRIFSIEKMDFCHDLGAYNMHNLHLLLPKIDHILTSNEDKR